MWIALLCNTLTVPAWPVAAAAWRDLCSYFIRNIICCAPGSQQAAWSGATARVQDTTAATRASNEGSRRLRVLQSRRRFVWSSTQQPHWRFSFYALYKEVLISCLGQPYCQFRKCGKEFFHASLLYCAIAIIGDISWECRNVCEWLSHSFMFQLFQLDIFCCPDAAKYEVADLFCPIMNQLLTETGI